MWPLTAPRPCAWQRNTATAGTPTTPEESAAVTRQRGEILDEFALELGRDPAEIRRTFDFGWTSDRWQDQSIKSREQLETLAGEIIPKLRKP